MLEFIIIGLDDMLKKTVVGRPMTADGALRYPRRVGVLGKSEADG
jgi:hypothetical protein